MAAVDVIILKNDLPLIPTRLRSAVADVNNRAMFRTIAIADPRTPVETGNLKNAKAVTPASPGDLVSEIHWTADYAGFVNGGTRFMAARPFATSAVEEVKPQWLADLAGIGAKL